MLEPNHSAVQTLIRTRAVPADKRYSITGTKIWITGGEL
jgi:alkylation response protein AidB-like acyl-CoA dehydrogenase